MIQRSVRCSVDFTIGHLYVKEVCRFLKIWYASSQTVLGDNPRKITFFHTYCGLLDFFKVRLL